MNNKQEIGINNETAHDIYDIALYILNVEAEYNVDDMEVTIKKDGHVIKVNPTTKDSSVTWQIVLDGKVVVYKLRPTFLVAKLGKLISEM